jgi:hypothetical protein
MTATSWRTVTADVTDRSLLSALSEAGLELTRPVMWVAEVRARRLRCCRIMRGATLAWGLYYPSAPIRGPSAAGPVVLP